MYESILATDSLVLELTSPDNLHWETNHFVGDWPLYWIERCQLAARPIATSSSHHHAISIGIRQKALLQPMYRVIVQRSVSIPWINNLQVPLDCHKPTDLLPLQLQNFESLS
jgi:hypothetical protein